MAAGLQFKQQSVGKVLRLNDNHTTDPPPPLFPPGGRDSATDSVATQMKKGPQSLWAES